jgi:hypothetical protein
VSTSNQEYKSEPGRIDPETVPAEAPNVFKRLGANTYVSRYDVYGACPYNWDSAKPATSCTMGIWGISTKA